MRTRIITLFALFFLAFSCFADDDSTKITVAVRNLNGKPIDRAAVIVRFVEGRSVLKLGKKMMTKWELRTNQEGLAKVPSMPQGKVRIQITAKGYQTFGQIFDVDQNEKTIEIKLNPPQQQYSAHE